VKKLTPHNADRQQVDRYLSAAERKLVVARKVLALDDEASLQLSYEVMLKAALGFMFSHGVRVRSVPGHHIATIEFVEQRLPRKHAPLLAVFDRLRRKRNAVLYDDEGFVSHQEAEEALRAAHEFIEVLRSDVLSRRAAAKARLP
jgi:hypothetical protein